VNGRTLRHPRADQQIESFLRCAVDIAAAAAHLLERGADRA